MIDTAIIAIVISGMGVIITAIFNSRNWNRNNNMDGWAERERTTRLEDQINNLTHEIKRSNKELSSDIQEVKGLVSDMSNSLKKTQIRHERLESKVESIARRLGIIEKWKEHKRR